MILMPPLAYTDMPAPDRIVTYEGGAFAPAMLHYAAEDADVRDVARQNGFDVKWLFLRDVIAEDHPAALYDDGDPALLVFWSPPAGTDGWTLSGKYDTEAGPVAIYLRPSAEAQAAIAVDALARGSSTGAHADGR